MSRSKYMSAGRLFHSERMYQSDKTHVASTLNPKPFAACRKEQLSVGRFFYRFPTGESGSDVYGRTKLWWMSGILPINERPGLDVVDVLVVVTHGLTMRLILMQERA